MFTPDWLGGTQFGDILTAQSQSTAAAFTSGSAVNLAGLTGKVLMIVDISAVSGNTFSIQLLSNTTNAVSGGTNFGSALVPTTVGPTAYSLDLEAFPAQYLYATLTLGGATHTAVFSMVYAASKKIV